MTLLPQTPPLRAEIFPAAFERQMQAVSVAVPLYSGERHLEAALQNAIYFGGISALMRRNFPRRLNGGCGLFLWPSIVFRRTPFGSGLAKRDLFWRQFCLRAEIFRGA